MLKQLDMTQELKMLINIKNENFVDNTEEIIKAINNGGNINYLVYGYQPLINYICQNINTIYYSSLLYSDEYQLYMIKVANTILKVGKVKIKADYDNNTPLDYLILSNPKNDIIGIEIIKLSQNILLSMDKTETNEYLRLYRNPKTIDKLENLFINVDKYDKHLHWFF